MAAARSQPDVIDLTISDPNEAGLWNDGVEELDSALRRSARPQRQSTLGLASARESLAESLSSTGDRVDPDDLVLCTSTSEAYSWIFRITCDPGDELVTPVPAYPLIDAIAELDSVKVIHAPMQRHAGQWEIDVDALAHAVTGRTRALVVVNPNNPTGHAVSLAERAALERLVPVPIISDEVFIDYPHDATPIRSLAASDSGRVFALGGISKSIALPHWKLGWIRLGGDADFRAEAREALEWIADTFLPVSVPVQLALPSLLRMKDGVQERIRERITQNLEAARNNLSQMAHVEVDRPDGGWTLLLRLPALCTDEQMVTALLDEHRVIVQPGFFYDVPFDGALVVSLLTEPHSFERGVARIASFAAEFA